MYHIGAAGSNSKPIATHVSVGIALIKFMGIVVLHLFLRIKKLKCLGKQSCLKTTKGKPKATNSMSTHQDTTAVTTSTFTVELREPLLEVSAELARTTN